MNKKCIFFLLILGLWLLNAVNLTAQVTGDVDENSVINIVDALMTAQYYVKMNPSPFDSAAADVDDNGTINIIDALIIVQYSVGLITAFPAAVAVPPLDDEFKVIRVPVVTLQMFEI